MQTLPALYQRRARPRAWPAWPYQACLWVLFLGPLAAPLFQATRLPLLADSGALARDLLALYVCPTPAKSYMLLGFPMAVCARCWGATIGLWAGWFAFKAWARGRRWAQPLAGYLAWAWPLRLLASALPFGLWSAEIVGWPAAPYWLLLINGALAGLSAGLFFCSIWPGLGATLGRSVMNDL